jgi:hypothetical protein
MDGPASRRSLFCCVVCILYSIPTSMKTPQVSTEGGRKEFLAELGRLWPAAKGSVAEVHKPCVRAGCKACAEGRKHRAFILAYKEGGRRRCLYVPERRVPALRAAIANGRHIEQLLSQCGAEMVKQARQRR